MTDEQTNKSDTVGKKSHKPDEGADKPLSLYDKTAAIVKRQEEANKKTEELITRQEKLQSDQALGGTGGGHVEAKPKEETPKEYNDRIEKEIGEGQHGD